MILWRWGLDFEISSHFTLCGNRRETKLKQQHFLSFKKMRYPSPKVKSFGFFQSLQAHQGFFSSCSVSSSSSSSSSKASPSKAASMASFKTVIDELDAYLLVRERKEEREKLLSINDYQTKLSSRDILSEITLPIISLSPKLRLICPSRKVSLDSLSSNRIQGYDK